MKITIGEIVAQKQSEKLAQLQTLLNQPRNYENFIESYLEYTKHQESTRKIHRWVAISIIAAALERKVYIDNGYFRTFPNLYIFIIGESGVVRKSTSTGIGVDLLRELDDVSIMAERVTASSLISQLERAKTTYGIADREENQSAVYCYASELIVFLNEVFGSISELLTTFYDCAPQDSQKPWIYETRGEGQIKIFGPCLNILGASTPTWLARAIPANEMEGGFSSRVIFVVEKENPDNYVPWPTLSDETKAMRPKLLEDLKRIHALRGVMQVTQAAKKHYSEWYVNFKRNEIRSTDSRFKGYYGRKPTTIQKVAMCLSVAESNSLILDERHFQQAERLLSELEEVMFEAFGAAGENPQAKGIQRLKDLIKDRTEISHKEIMKILWQNFNGSEVNQIVADLMRMGFMKIQSARGDAIMYAVLKQS